MNLNDNNPEFTSSRAVRSFAQEIYISLIKNQTYKYTTSKEMVDYSFKLAIDFYKNIIHLEEKYYG